MGALYFFSGFDRELGFTIEIAESLREHINERKTLAFIASCPYDHETTDFYKNVNDTWFRNSGIMFENITVVDDRKSEIECIEIINGASAVFLAGGTTFLQFDFIKKNNLVPILKQFDGVVMGMSAGAINMAVNSFYSADKDNNISQIYKGIGLADISVEPHFSMDNRELLEKEILPFSELINIYAMSDNSAMVVNGTSKRFYGNIYLASKGRINQLLNSDDFH
jgi:peptidase E